MGVSSRSGLSLASPVGLKMRRSISFAVFSQAKPMVMASACY